MNLKELDGYEAIWKKVTQDGLTFDKDGEMDEATKACFLDALKPLMASFEPKSFEVSLEFLMRNHVLMRKHIHYEDVVGKMFLQQFIYNVFSALLLSACSKAGDYKADQMVRPSLPCLFRETPDENVWRYGDFQAKPDAVSSMDSGCDPFAMMELRTLYTRRNATIVDE
ncbi:unnamed protein product, partial [Cylindrotheca closterium]